MPDFQSIEAFVSALGGRRVLRKVLIANNGIAAVKCIRSVRRWAYETFGNEREVSRHVVLTVRWRRVAEPQPRALPATHVHAPPSSVRAPHPNPRTRSALPTLADPLRRHGDASGPGRQRRVHPHGG